MYKVVLLINSVSGIPCGWSETYYCGLTSVQATATKAGELIGQRAKIMASDYGIIGARLTGDILAPPTATQLFVPKGQQNGLLGAAEDYPNTSVLYQVRGPLSAHQSRQLRGWPDSFIEAGPGNLPVRLSADGQGKLSDFITYLAAGGWGWLRASKPSDGGNKSFKVTSLTAGTDGSRTTMNGPVPAEWVTTPVPIAVRGFKGGLAKFNGNYAAKSITVTSTGVTIDQYTYTGAIVGYPADTATVSGGAPVLVPIQTGTYLRVSSKKTGRPFGLLRGRRSKA